MKKNHSKSENKYLCRAYQTKDPIQIYKEMSKLTLETLVNKLKMIQRFWRGTSPKKVCMVSKQGMYGKQEGMYGKQAYKHDPYLH